MFYLMKDKNKTVSSLPRVLFTLALTSALQHYVVFSNHQGQNRITIQPNRVFFHYFETIPIIYDTG